MKLEGKKVWITGASGAIGKAVAERFKAEGATLYSARVDITNIADVLATVRNIDPDILVNCAGQLGPVAPVQYADVAEWIRTINVNLIGPYYLTRAVALTMLKKGGGKIILFSGGGGGYGYPYHSAYAASKAGLVRFVETVAEELKPMNIFINAIAPGPVKSKMNPTGGTPNAAVKLALHLASGDSGELTGRLISALYDSWENPNYPSSTEAGKLRRIPFNQ